MLYIMSVWNEILEYFSYILYCLNLGFFILVLLNLFFIVFVCVYM